MADWLSAMMVVVVLILGWRSWCTQRASLTVLAAAMYAASVVETATVACRREVQLMAPLLLMTNA
jgi:hypothetical protein